MLISRKLVRARKRYTCDVNITDRCARTIRERDHYWRLYGAAERCDPPYVMRVCEPCQEWYESTRGPGKKAASA